VEFYESPQTDCPPSPFLEHANEFLGRASTVPGPKRPSGARVIRRRLLPAELPQQGAQTDGFEVGSEVGSFEVRLFEVGWSGSGRYKMGECKISESALRENEQSVNNQGE
jgi:hypothetical protein